LSISSNGRYLSFDHAGDAATTPHGCPFPEYGPQAGRTQVYQRDLVTGAVSMVSLAASGACALDGANSLSAGSMSADGRFVVFESRSSNLTPGDTNNIYDVFVKQVR
jgi:Tol biopolymer transport system component